MSEIKGILAAPGDDLVAGELQPQLTPIANEPLVAHALEAIVGLGIRDVAVIASPSAGQGIRAVLGDGRRWGARVAYVDQVAPRGIVEALCAADEFLDGHPVLVHRGDMLLGSSLQAVLDEFLRDGLDAMLMVAPSRSAGEIARPDEWLSRSVLAGAQLFSPSCVALVGEHAESCEGRISLRDALRRLASADGRIGLHTSADWWAWDGTLQNLLEGNRLVLGRIAPDRIIHPTAEIQSSTIEGPVVVGAGARISDAYIGPYTSIGERAEIHGAAVENSIVLPAANIEYVKRPIEASIVGANARISGDVSLPSALRLWVGDHAEVSLA